MSIYTIFSLLWSLWNNLGAGPEQEVLLSVTLKIRRVGIGAVSVACIIRGKGLPPAGQLSLQFLVSHVYGCCQPPVVWSGRGVTLQPCASRGLVRGGALYAGHPCQMNDAFPPSGLRRDQWTVLRTDAATGVI